MWSSSFITKKGLTNTMKLYDIHGNVMMEISPLDRKGDDLVTKGKMMGAMPASIFLRPNDLWQAKSLLSWRVIRYLPSMAIKGWKQSRKQPSPKK